MGEVALVNVSKRFTLRAGRALHSVLALDRVSFSVKDGEIASKNTRMNPVQDSQQVDELIDQLEMR